MVEFVVTSVESATDDEAAACIAAVHVLLQSEENVASDKAEPVVNAWAQASRLEGTGRARQINLPPSDKSQSLWSASNKPRTFGWLAAAMLLSTTQALAQVEPAPQVVLRPAMPELAMAAGDTIPSAPAPRKMMRVALALQRAEIAIGLPDGGQLRDASTNDVLAELPPQSSWKVAAMAPGGYSQFRFDGSINNVSDGKTYIVQGTQYKTVGFTPSIAPKSSMVPLPQSQAPGFFLPALKSDGNGSSLQQKYDLVPNGPDFAFVFGGKVYRGIIKIQPHADPKPAATSKAAKPPVAVAPAPRGGLDLINTVELEDYLQSVVPSEMPSGWPLEALKAQAVAARSYAVANIGKHQIDGYDVKATIEDQVYSGVGSESPNSNRAVAETAGQVLTHQGKTVAAFFHSASGGHTEFAENVWSRSVPYLKAVPDFDDESPHFNWNRPFSPEAAEQALQRQNKSVGALLAIMPVWRGISPRVRWLMISGTQRTLIISGEEARKIFSLPSASFNVAPADASYVFAGRGFGHGLGMSQWGAKRLAESGLSAHDILNYYYKDVVVQGL